MLLKHCPGMAEAHVLLAEAHHLAGHAAVELSKQAHLLQRDKGSMSGHQQQTRNHLSNVR